jgi:hypothetical protein
MQLKKRNAPTGNITVEIQTDNGSGVPSGTVLATATINSATLAAGYGAFKVATACALTKGAKYHVCLKGQAAWDGTNDIDWGYLSGAGFEKTNYGAGNFATNGTVIQYSLKTYYGNAWTVPTYTPTNLIQRPIFETRLLAWDPIFSATTLMTYTSVTVDYASYQIAGKTCFIYYRAVGTTGGTAGEDVRLTLPIAHKTAGLNYPIHVGGSAYDNGKFKSTALQVDSALQGGATTNIVYNRLYDYSKWTIGATEYVLASFMVPY